MKSILLVFVLYCSQASATSWLIGVGDIYQADESGYKMYSLSVEKNIWKVNLSKWDAYPKTAWLKTNPEWGVDYVDSHYMAAILGTLFQHEMNNELKVYFDFGLTYTSKLSKANSSYLSFQENLGIAYKSFRIFFRHTSNANIKGANRGEDALVFEVGFNF